MMRSTPALAPGGPLDATNAGGGGKVPSRGNVGSCGDLGAKTPRREPTRRQLAEALAAATYCLRGQCALCPWHDKHQRRLALHMDACERRRHAVLEAARDDGIIRQAALQGLTWRGER